MGYFSDLVDAPATQDQPSLFSPFQAAADRVRQAQMPVGGRRESLPQPIRDFNGQPISDRAPDDYLNDLKDPETRARLVGQIAPLALMFAGPSAKTADLKALDTAKEMASAGHAREPIWDQTGWFQGADGKWRFEIDDSKSAISPRVAQEFGDREIGGQVPVQNADRFFDHPGLFDAYPDLWSVNTRLTKGGGYPYMPAGHYFVRESGAEGIGLNAGTLPQALSMGLHELQHAVQRREGLAAGADAEAVGMKDYSRTAGEVEAYNVQRRKFMTDAERKAAPPWTTEDVPYEQQILQYYPKAD